jgi:hypothetical protein
MLSSADSLDLFRLVVQQAPDGIIFADREGLRHAHWEGFGKAVASGHTKHGTDAMKTRATHKAGQKLYVSLAFSVVKDREGKVIGAMATARPFAED